VADRVTGFSVGKDKCDECIYEAILKDHPNYTIEPWGNMPIWAEYYKKAPEVMCMIHYGDTDFEAVCLKHIEEMRPDAD